MTWHLATRDYSRPVLAVLALVVPWFASSSQSTQPLRTSALIIEGRGIAGPYALGDSLSHYIHTLRAVPSQKGVYLSKDSTFRITASPDARIAKLEVLNRAAFTTRLIRAETSTLQDVFDKYGKAHKFLAQNGELLVAYDGLQFVVGIPRWSTLSAAQASALLDQRVTRIVMTSTRAPKQP